MDNNLQRFAFRSMWHGCKRTGYDCSKKTQPQFKEIPPFARDSNGKFINDSADVKLIPAPDRDIDEFIQSFKDEGDVYKVLQACLDTNSLVPAQQVTGGYGDISGMPTNYQEYDRLIEAAKALDLESIKKQLMDENAKQLQAQEKPFSKADIEAMIIDKINSLKGGNV